MDAARLVRAVHLTVERVAPGRYLVTGGAEPHEVTVDAAGTLRCACTDALVHRGAIGCKHTLAVRLMRADADVLEALRDVVPMPKRARRARVAR